MLKKIIVIRHINMLKKKIHTINLTDARTKVLIFDNLVNTQEKCMGFPCGSAGKESTCSAGDLGLIPGWEEPWGRERLPTPVLWPGEFHGLYSQSMVSQRVWQSWATFTFTWKMHSWRDFSKPDKGLTLLLMVKDQMLLWSFFALLWSGMKRDYLISSCLLMFYERS